MKDLLRQLIREMAQAQTRKLGIKRDMPIDILKSYVSDPPQYAIRESDVERPLYNPNSKVDQINTTPLGTYMYPLNEYIYRMLIEERLGEFGNKYIHLFKIPDGMLYLGEQKSDITDQDIIAFLKEIDPKVDLNFIKETLKSRDSKNDLLYQLITGEDFQEHYNLINKEKKYGYSRKDHLRTNHPKITKALIKIGVKGFVDLGNGIIFNGGIGGLENTQLVVIDPILTQNSFIRTFNFKSLLSHSTLIKKHTESDNSKINDDSIKKAMKELGNAQAFKIAWDKMYYVPEDSWIWSLYNPENYGPSFNEMIFISDKTPLDIRRKLYHYDKIDVEQKIRTIFYKDKNSLKDLNLLDSFITEYKHFYSMIRELKNLNPALLADDVLIKHFLEKENIKEFILLNKEKFPLWFKQVVIDRFIN